jgi:glucose/arabinose dehydrogenase
MHADRTRSRTPRPSTALALALLAAASAGASACTAAPATGQVHRSEQATFRVETVVTGLEHPWGMAFLPEGDPSGAVLVTEREGRLRVIRRAGRSGDAGGGAGAGRTGPTGWVLAPEPVSGVPEVWASGQGGLLDVALHPRFETNRLVYLSYSKPGGMGLGATTAVIRGRLRGNRLVDVEEILEADAWRRSRVHFGSRMAFDGDGHLFVTIGERGEMEAAQDRSNHQGVTLRLHDDGSVPDDNPFVGVRGVRPEIWTWGNRSPQGLAFDRETGVLWQTEHGPRGGDELNVLVRGGNYGWPAITYGVNYDGSPITEATSREGMEQPVHHWVPSIATSGVMIYRGELFPEWRGDAFVGGLRGTQLARVELERTGDGAGPGSWRSAGWESLLEGYGRVRDVREAPDGTIWLLLDQGDAPVVRLTPDE